MDKGYEFPEVYELLEEYGYTIHIRLKGKERRSIKKEYQTTELDDGLLKEPILGLTELRRLLIRWEKRIENDIGMLHFACGWITLEEVDFSHRLLVNLEHFNSFSQALVCFF